MSQCASCGKSISFLTRVKSSIDGKHYCSDCSNLQHSSKPNGDNWRRENQSQIPNSDDPLNCAFQRRFTLPYRVQCSLTGIGSGGVISRTFADYESCRIDICPMYQSWNKEN